MTEIMNQEMSDGQLAKNKPPTEDENLSQYHQPQKPSNNILKAIERLIVNTHQGKVVSNGQEIGSLNQNGYCYIAFGNKRIKRCHIVWYKAKGEWPKLPIDHKNRIRSDDRLENLKLKTHADNMMNKAPRKNKSGLPTGVRFMKGNKTNPYRAMGSKDSQEFVIGNFPTVEQAHEAYLKYRQEREHEGNH